MKILLKCQHKMALTSFLPWLPKHYTWEEESGLFRKLRVVKNLWKILAVAKTVTVWGFHNVRKIIKNKAYALWVSK